MPKPESKRMGRPPRAKQAATRVITIRLTEQEHALWKRRAGDQPLTDWIRVQCKGSVT